MFLINILKKYEEFIRFGIVGVINTVLSLIVYNILLWFDVNFLIANAFGYAIGILNGYILSSKIVFKKNMRLENGSKFILTYISSFAIGSVILYLLVEIFNIDKRIAPLVVSAFNVIYNYFINKIWTFNK